MIAGLRTRRRASGPEPGETFSRILIASEGREISDAVLTRARVLAAPGDPKAHVLSIARVFGTSFGFPNPGLLPTKREWDAQGELVTWAVERLQRMGIPASGRVLGTRKGARRICEEADFRRCGVIVMGADRDRSPLIASMMWSQEPQRVRARARIPVVLVIEDG